MALDRTCFGLPLHLSVFAVIRPFDFTLCSKAMISSIYGLLRHRIFNQHLEVLRR
jgi:hypothetical protein